MKKISLNDRWLFRRLPGFTLENLPEDLLPFPGEEVTLPHTWHREDAPYKGLCVYEKTLARDPSWKKALLSFDGADQSCRVFVNGFPAGAHQGGYSRFRLPLPEEAETDAQWTVRVFLENRVNEQISPNFGDFTVFGGLYRNADLLVMEPSHFDYCYFGTDGIVVRASVDPEGRGIVTVEPHAVCDPERSRIRCSLRNDRGKEIARREGRPDETFSFAVEHPALWNGLESRAFFTVSAELCVDGTPVDRTDVRTGFRRVEVSGQKGFLLNGKPLQLRGAAKHQDRCVKYSAVSEEDVREDFSILREMGANAVRLSHYQHPQPAYNCCDEEGLLCWAEIPMLKMTEDPALQANAVQQLTELILQNIHHPSVFCWGIQNEIAMFRDAPFMHENCRELHALVKTLDPGRLSACANLYPLKAASRLNEITDLVGYNLYFGWYYGEMPDYGPWLDAFHEKRPSLPLGITEYGVDANLSLHSEAPKVKDYSEEYQALWHETVYPQIERRPWLWGSFIWNMFDFSSDRRDEGGQKGINAKGLVTHDRKTRKDAFYYYKARWSSEPFLHLCAKRFLRRAREAVDVKCYTNQPSVRLVVNGNPFGEVSVENGTALFRNVPLSMGENRVAVSAGVCRDECAWIRVSEPDPAYTLPEEQGSGPVRNWFLAEDDCRREGFYSIQDTANDLLENPDTRKILEAYVPGLVRFMTEKSVIPLGLAMKSILSRETDDSLDLKKMNRELNQVPNQ